MTPAVSVIIPTYNGSRFLEEAVASVYAQTATPAQVIVVDDGSTDDTGDLLRDLERRFPSMHVLRKDNGGTASARNAGFTLATEDYVAFLDVDDLWHPTKLERQLDHLSSDPELVLSFTAYNRVEGTSASIVRHNGWDPDPDIVLRKLMTFCAVGPPSTVLMRREVLTRIPWDERVRVGADWQMGLNMATAGMRMGYLQDALVDYRWHGGNESADDALVREDACEMFDRFLIRTDLPLYVRSRANYWRAYWHMHAAIQAIQSGDKHRSRRHIWTAARLSPRSIRLGWIRMLGLGIPPP